MEADWRADKFSLRMQILIADYCEALNSKDVPLAEKNLVALGADYSGACAQWVVVLRHLLLAVQKSIESPAPSEQLEPQPILLPVYLPPTTTI